MVQVVVKGKEGEREVCRLLNRQLSALVQSGRYDVPTVTMLQNVVQRNYTAGVAIFELDSTMAAEEFSELLVLKPPQGLKLQVLNVSAGKVDLRAVAAP